MPGFPWEPPHLEVSVGPLQAPEREEGQGQEPQVLALPTLALHLQMGKESQ